MTDKEFVIEAIRLYGKAVSQSIQDNSSKMSNTDLVDEESFLPDFDNTSQYNDSFRYPAGTKNGYVCRTAAGNVVRLLQNYDSITYPQQPEELEAQWGFAWSTDPKKAKPFLKKATSPYNENECCIENGHVYRSTHSSNVWSPSEYHSYWEDLGPVSEFS